MRIQVNLSDDIILKIDEYAKRIGVPRASLLSVWIGQTVDQIGKFEELSEERAREVLAQDIN